MSTELFRETAQYFDSKDLQSLCLTCCKTIQDIQAVLFQHPSIHILRDHLKLQLFVKSCYSTGSARVLHVQNLCIEYSPMDDSIYQPQVPRMAMVPRLGGA
ncbi:uncharacterized protein IWZ02DRAFT_494733 [Phyllosticta citriasiana]|uniref:uncharacterized protein n=1 Tax=Phyllosticta citriasiana TaxID=595635 RepID=UPI0030FD8C13